MTVLSSLSLTLWKGSSKQPSKLSAINDVTDTLYTPRKLQSKVPGTGTLVN